MSRSSKSINGTRPTADASFWNRLADSGCSPRPRLLPCSVDMAAGAMPTVRRLGKDVSKTCVTGRLHPPPGTSRAGDLEAGLPSSSNLPRQSNRPCAERTWRHGGQHLLREQRHWIERRLLRGSSTVRHDTLVIACEWQVVRRLIQCPQAISSVDDHRPTATDTTSNAVPRSG